MVTPAIEGGQPVRSDYLPFSPPGIGEEEVQAVTGVLRSGWITTGPRCAAFEQALTHYTGAKYAVPLSSATAGLFLCLKLHGIGDGDEVITTPYTFAATANSIIHTGATPVFADVEDDTLNIAPSEIEKKITPRTKAVIPVHFAGHPASMDEICEVAGEYDITIIEDWMRYAKSPESTISRSSRTQPTQSVHPTGAGRSEAAKTRPCSPSTR